MLNQTQLDKLFSCDLQQKSQQRRASDIVGKFSVPSNSADTQNV